LTKLLVFNFRFGAVGYDAPTPGTVDFDFNVEFEFNEPLFNVRNVTGMRYDNRAQQRNVVVTSKWQRSDTLAFFDTEFTSNSARVVNRQDLHVKTILSPDLFNMEAHTFFVSDSAKLNNMQDASLITFNRELPNFQLVYAVESKNIFNHPAFNITQSYDNFTPPVDVHIDLPAYSVRPSGYVRGFDIVQRTVNNIRFDFADTAQHAEGSQEINKFDFSIAQPTLVTSFVVDDRVYFKTPAQPVWTGQEFSVVKSPNQSDINARVQWGYGANNFLIGGVTDIPSTPADGLIEEPLVTIDHINYEVLIVVNNVTIRAQPSDTAIAFDGFTVQRDLESFAWSVNFTVLNKASFDLIRPQGRTLKTIEVDINDELFTFVIAKASIQRKQGVISYRCSGWSPIKMLTDPYAGKRSYRDTQGRTAAQIVVMELTGTGFTSTWDTIDWAVPLGIHSYQDKTPLGAVLEVVNAIGGVIVPHNSDESFKVTPYYPVSPWQWGDETPNRSMSILQFFETNGETIPKENPDGAYIYGEETGGVGVKVVRNGLPGTALLPDIVNKYITANTAGQERGRVEVSKNSFIERITMSTYVDLNGIIYPQELIKFTDDGADWLGMVLSTNVQCAKLGTALIQTITVARFYDN